MLRAVVCLFVLAAALGPSATPDNATRVAQRFVELAKAKGWTVAYCGANLTDLSLVATVNWPQEGFTTHLHLLDERGKVLWRETLPNEFVQTVYPWLGNPHDPPTFVIVTHGGAGVGYVVSIVGEVGGKGRLLARETGWGLAPVPEMALLGDTDRPSIILAPMDEYKGAHQHAVVLSWDAKHQKVTKRRVPWSKRFQG